MRERPAEYKKLITIPGIKRGELKESLKVDPNKVSRLSWSEQLLAKSTNSHGTDIIRYLLLLPNFVVTILSSF